MRQRCLNPLDGAFKHYGGRGISICDRWGVFENFLADMGPLPAAGYEIDRIDVNGNYEPGNCRWATHKVQANNKRTSLFFTHDGRTQTLSQWANEAGLKMHTLYRRVVVRNMPLAQALQMAPLSRTEASRMASDARWGQVDPLTRKRQKLLCLPRAAQRSLFREARG